MQKLSVVIASEQNSMQIQLQLFMTVAARFESEARGVHQLEMAQQAEKSTLKLGEENLWVHYWEIEEL